VAATDHGNDFALLMSAMTEAAALARDYFTADPRAWEKRPGQPVTEADLAVDALLHERLCGARPDYGWLSEESRDDPARLAKRRLWIVDPIDGTRAFIRRRPHFTVCGALIEETQPRLAVVINPMTEEIFTAEAGRGARRNGEPISVAPTTSLGGARILGNKDFFELDRWGEPWPNDMSFDNPNSVAYRLCLIAAGERDAIVRLFTSHEWDVAAADLIVREAGGVVTEKDGRGLHYNQPQPRQTSVIAAGPGLYPEIYRRVLGFRWS
jgi:myo-inositol-1(or 4)-monophosphatase